MGQCTAWIVTDEALMATDLRAMFQQLRDCDVGVASVHQWLDGQVPVERPQWLVFDLRRGGRHVDQLWRDLPNARKRSRHLPGKPLPCVAIVDQGVPIEAAKLADRIVGACSSWPVTVERFSGILNQAETQASEFLRHDGLESRVVHSESYTFRTYTPSLFPLLDRLETAARHEFTILLLG